MEATQVRMMQPINKIYLYVFSIWQGKILIYFMSLVVEYERITNLRDFHFTSDNHVYLIFIHTFFSKGPVLLVTLSIGVTCVLSYVWDSVTGLIRKITCWISWIHLIVVEFNKVKLYWLIYHLRNVIVSNQVN